jgi:hypothetical protein
LEAESSAAALLARLSGKNRATPARLAGDPENIYVINHVVLDIDSLSFGLSSNELFGPKMWSLSIPVDSRHHDPCFARSTAGGRAG